MSVKLISLFSTEWLHYVQILGFNVGAWFAAFFGYGHNVIVSVTLPSDGKRMDKFALIFQVWIDSVILYEVFINEG